MPQKMIIRNEKPNDYSTVEALHQEAFRKEKEALVVRNIRLSPYYRSDYSLVAEDGAGIIGHLLVSYIGLRNSTNQIYKIPIIAPLSVKPTKQREGVGTKLVEHALSKLDSSAEKLVVVRGDGDYYKRFGFLSSNEFEIYPPKVIPQGRFHIKPLSNYDPSYKGTILYPEAFSCLEYPVDLFI